MSHDLQCHNESKNRPGPKTSSASPHHGDLVKIPDCNIGKVKRRKTKKELNNAKFKSHTETFKKKTFHQGDLQRNNMVSKMASKSGGQEMCNARRVFITQNRLTHHQGIFNREVKSIDIGRLVETSKNDAAQCLVESVRDTPQSQRSLSLGLIPTPKPKNQDVPEKQPSPELPAHVSEPAPCNQQVEESVKCQSCPQSDDHAEPGSGTTTFSCRSQPPPILETAESIVYMLNKHPLFPGRNLISETRRAILERVKNLRDAKTTPAADPVQRRPEYNHTGSSRMCEDQAWESATDIRKSVQDNQRTIQPIRTSPVRFLTLPRDSPAHTLIKMMNPEDDLRLKDILPQAVHYGADSNLSHQYQEISSGSPHNLLNSNSSSHGGEPRRQDRNTSSLCRVKKAETATSSPVPACSPQVRWKLADDFLTDPSYTHNSSSKNIRNLLTSQRNSQERVSRIPLGDISGAPNTSRVRTKQQCSDDKISSDVFWSTRDQRTPNTKILDISPAAIRLSYRTKSPPRISQNSVFLQTGASTHVFPMDSIGESRRRPQRQMSSWLEADVGQHCRRFATNTMPKQKPWCHNWWNPPSFLRDEPKHRVYMGNERDIGWFPSKDWSHVEHYRSVASSPRCVQQELPFVPYQHRRSSKKTSPRSSPAPWVYPRMKLY